MLLIVLSIVVGLAVLAGATLWWMRTIWFHRDPDHTKTAQDDLTVLSPVYGRVSYIRKVCDAKVVSTKLDENIPISDITKEAWPADEPSGDGWLIGIAMTALDVHFQYAPVPGEMGSIHHFQTGMNLPMFDLWEYIHITWLRKTIQLFGRRYVLENERQTMWVKGKKATVALVLIADKFIDKITTFTASGRPVPSGGKLSFIGRGSQVDLVICGHPDLEILVREGQAVYGPLTTVARLKG